MLTKRTCEDCERATTWAEWNVGRVKMEAAWAGMVAAQEKRDAAQAEMVAARAEWNVGRVKMETAWAKMMALASKRGMNQQ